VISIPSVVVVFAVAVVSGVAVIVAVVSGVAVIVASFRVAVIVA
jgi:hypothetical protein